MLKNLLSIVPFVIVTVVVYAVVELFYGMLTNSFLVVDSSPVRVQVADKVVKKDVSKLQKYSDYSIITSRNLFQSSAQVNAQDTSAEQADPYAGIEATKLELVLMGTITGQDGSDRAIIYKKREKKQEIYYQGDAIEGALIKRILRGRIILEYQGNDEILDMSEASTVGRQTNPAAQAVSPVVRRNQVLSRPSSQVPRRRVISRGAQPRSVTPEEMAPAEETVEQGQEELVPEELVEENTPEEIIDQEVEPETETDSINPEQTNTENTN